MPLTMMVSVRSKYDRHQLVVLVEHLVVVLRAKLRCNNGSRFNEDTSTNGIVRQPVSVGTRHRDMDARHQDKEAFGDYLRQESCKAENARTRQKRSADLPLAPKHRPTHRSMAHHRGRWHRCYHCSQPIIIFSACRRKGGDDVGPRTGSTSLPPRCRATASPPSPTTILPRVLRL